MKKEEYIKRYGVDAYKEHLQQCRDWTAQHHEACNAKNRKWRAAHREEANATSRKWHAAHRDKCNASSRDWNAKHREEMNLINKRWRANNPDVAKASDSQKCRKGGKYYNWNREYQRTGLQGERNKIRDKHKRQHRAIKQATPNSVLHHEWIPGTANYRGVALVEKEAHENGIIKVILILEGQITLFTEKEIREQEERK